MDASLDQETDLEKQARGERGRERDTRTRGASAVGGFAVDCGLGRSYLVHSVCSVLSVLNGTLCSVVSMSMSMPTAHVSGSGVLVALSSHPHARFPRANLASKFF